MQILVGRAVFALQLNRGVAGDLRNEAIDHGDRFPLVVVGCWWPDILTLMTCTRGAKRHRPGPFFAVVVALLERIVIVAMAFSATRTFVTAVSIDLRIHMRVAAGIKFERVNDIRQIDEAIVLTAALAVVRIGVTGRVVRKAGFFGGR